MADQSKSASDNRNAENTYPPDAKPVSSPAVGTQTSNNSLAPLAADPLNGGIPQHSIVDNRELAEPGLEVGGSGSYIFAGFLGNVDYNPDFSGVNRIKLFDEMRLSDATVRLGLSAVKYPIIAARWYIKPGRNDSEDSQRVSLVKEELFKNPNFSFTQFLRQALSFCENGNSLFEKVFRLRADGKIGWLKFAPRLSNTILRYTLDDGKTPGIVQILPTGGHVEIPLSKLLLMVLDMEGADYEGRSLLRYCYKHFFYKNLYYKIDSIAAERQGCGFPVLYSPPQATQKDKDKAREIAQNIRVNEQSYADLPIGFKIEWQDMKASGNRDVKEMILHHDRQILKAFMAHFLDMGAASSGSGGTRSLSSDQSDFFYLAENYIAQTFQDIVNIAIRELVDLNFSGTKADEYPTLEYAGLGKVDLKNYGDFIKNMAEAGVIIPDDDLERHVRQVAELPESNRMSGEDNNDPETEKIRVPQLNPLDPSQVQQRKPVRYASNATVQAQPRKPMVNKEYDEAMHFMEDVFALQERVEKAIENKEPVTV